MAFSTTKVAVNGWAVLVEGNRVATVTKHADGFTVWDGPKPSKATALVTGASKSRADEVIEKFVAHS